MAKIGLFTPSADSAPLPASSEGPSASPGATGGFEGADTTGLPAPARNVRDLQGQIGALITAFRASENRDPTPEDKEFWAAYDTLIQRYAQSYERPEVPERVRG
jgi:hypothetical protein